MKQAPLPVKDPSMIRLNRALAEELGLDADVLASPAGLAMLAGNALPDGAEPLAMAYAGHQFGHFVPQLGDGRAILLGEVVMAGGERRDIQLKGAGRTAFSRGGDGRAWLGPVIREYILSEAMHALKVPTTRALAAVRTGETVIREAPRPGGIVTRVASSHIRVGTFQYFAAREDSDALRLLTDYAIERHYPEAKQATNRCRAFLQAVSHRQARLVAKWLQVGFIHGVMNTDNMAISGETIDYGPCAFMDEYDPQKTFSSIDPTGRFYEGYWGDVGGTLLNMPGTFGTAFGGAMNFGSGIMAAPFCADVSSDFFQLSQEKSFSGQVYAHGGSHEDAVLAAGAISTSAVVALGGGTAGILGTQVTVASGMTGTMTSTVGTEIAYWGTVSTLAAGFTGKAAYELSTAAGTSAYVWASTTAGQAALTRTAIGLFGAGFVYDQVGGDNGINAFNGTSLGPVLAETTILIELGAYTSQGGTAIGNALGDGIVWGLNLFDQNPNLRDDFYEYLRSDYLNQHNVTPDPTGKYVKP